MRPFNLKSLQTKKDIARIVLALFFIVASILHFSSDVELKIIPPFLPWRRAALYITGIFELLGGIGLLIPRFQRAAAWGLVALLIAIFPANVYHAVKNIHLGGITDYPLYHWIRLPFQAVFIWWALWSTSKKGRLEGNHKEGTHARRDTRKAVCFSSIRASRRYSSPLSLAH